MATITVTAKSELGFRRCGMKFTREPRTLVEGTDVTSAQVEVLKAEPMLVVKDVEVKTPPPGDDLTAKELIGKIKGMADVKELGELFKGETRSTVKDALKARIKELKDAAKAAENK